LAKTLTVSQLNKYIKGVFEDELILHDIMVAGEVSEFRVVSSNTYLVLKDADSILNCYRPATTENVEIGTQVTLTGTVSYFPKGGRLSFTFSDIKLSGKSDQYVDFLKLKEKLKSEGFFDRKRPLPQFIKSVAIITSAEGAALADFLKVTSIQPFVKIKVFHSRVQGENACEDILNCFNFIRSFGTQFDLVVLSRGGGGQTDLSVFNDEKVARAVFDCQYPVMTAIGHEIDNSLCDLCSDYRVSTPTRAGEFIVESNQQIINEYFSALSKITNIVERKFQTASSDMYRKYLKSLVAKSEIQSKASKKLLNLLLDLKVAMDKKIALGVDLLKEKITVIKNLILINLSDRDGYLEKVRLKIDALNPTRLLNQGYAKIIKSHQEVGIYNLSIGDKIDIVMEGGRLTASIENISKRK